MPNNFTSLKIPRYESNLHKREVRQHFIVSLISANKIIQDEHIIFFYIIAAYVSADYICR